MVATTETTHCVECGDELPAGRAELGYTYCTKDTCQRKHNRGLRVTVLGTNKGAEIIVTGDADEVRRRGEAGELSTKDTGLGLDYRSPVAGSPAAVQPPRRPAPQPAARPWTAQQEKLVRLYHDMGLSPGRIAERARQTAPRLGITERLAVQILSAPPR
ncbi:MAG TPA: hypothetical protein VFX16_31020 [Pseudonocardiaceae bacterium]|nr:hypothetical protein [Pseudonocardiaceae bacterium]